MDFQEMLKGYENDVNEIHNLVTVGPFSIERETDILEKINIVAQDINIDYDEYSKNPKKKIKRRRKTYNLLRLLFSIICTIMLLLPVKSIAVFIFTIYVCSKYLLEYKKTTQECLDKLKGNANKFEKLKNRLKNYENILKVRIHKLTAKDFCENKVSVREGFDIELANMFINDYFEDRLYNLKQIPEQIRLIMQKMLQEDLQDSSENLQELLEKARIKSLNNGFTRNLKRD